MSHHNAEDEREQQGGSGLAWFITGLAIGAAIAILYAPKTGKETRRILSEKTQEGREAIGITGRDVLERSREIYEKGRQIVDDAAELFERGRKLARG